MPLGYMVSLSSSHYLQTIVPCIRFSRIIVENTIYKEKARFKHVLPNDKSLQLISKKIH